MPCLRDPGKLAVVFLTSSKIRRVGLFGGVKLTDVARNAGCSDLSDPFLSFGVNPSIPRLWKRFVSRVPYVLLLRASSEVFPLVVKRVFVDVVGNEPFRGLVYFPMKIGSRLSSIWKIFSPRNIEVFLPRADAPGPSLQKRQVFLVNHCNDSALERKRNRLSHINLHFVTVS